MPGWLKELRIRLPVGRYECYECPGAFFFQWPALLRIHRWRDDTPSWVESGPARSIGDDYAQTCTSCGIRRVVKGFSLLSQSGLSIEKYLGFSITPTAAAGSPAVAWAEDDVWDRQSVAPCLDEEGKLEEQDDQTEGDET